MLIMLDPIERPWSLAVAILVLCPPGSEFTTLRLHTLHGPHLVLSNPLPTSGSSMNKCTPQHLSQVKIAPAESKKLWLISLQKVCYATLVTQTPLSMNLLEIRHRLACVVTISCSTTQISLWKLFNTATELSCAASWNSTLMILMR